MFLLVRSALCIGIVVAALPDGLHQSVGDAAIGRVPTRSAGAVVDRFCHESPARCLAVLDRMTLATRRTGTGGSLPHWAGPALAMVD